MKAMLAMDYLTDLDPAGWLLSEKLDGVRALWTGSELVSRNGNAFSAPEWFIADLPAGCALDGELYCGRGTLGRAAGIVRRKSGSGWDWRHVRYMVFDAPKARGGFEKRLARARKAVSRCQHAEIVEHTECRDSDHLAESFSEIVAGGGEGVMLRRPGSAYEGKRSFSLLKYKAVDASEAEVVGYTVGNRALACRIAGIEFRVGAGLTNALRENPPAVGSVVTFTHNGTTHNGTPRNPVFVAVRDYE